MIPASKRIKSVVLFLTAFGLFAVQCKKEETKSFSWPDGLPGRIICTTPFSILIYESKGLTDLTKGLPDEYSDPKWSPDGTEILCVEVDPNGSDNGVALHIISSVGTGGRSLLLNGASGCWSPDGKRILYTHREIFNWGVGPSELWVVDANGENNHRLENFKGTTPDWSPDSNHIVVSDEDDIFIINLSDNLTTKLTDGGFNWSAEFSPDGSQIVYSHKDSFDSPQDIFVMNVDGSGKTNLTNSLGYCYDPTWSPDGTMIAFGLAGKESTYDLNVINSDGTGLVRIGTEDDDYPNSQFDWTGSD